MPFDSEITETNPDLIVLERARARIARNGWSRAGYRIQPFEGYCMLVACGEVPLGVQPDYNELYKFAPLLGFSSGADALTFNDAPGRTQDEVLTVFDAAIARLSNAIEARDGVLS